MQNLPVTTDTHDLTLRLQSQSGPTIDPEDVLSDVVLGSETIFAVFSQRTTSIGEALAPPQSRTSGDASVESSAAAAGAPLTQPIEGDTISIRVITPATAKQVRSSL